MKPRRCSLAVILVVLLAIGLTGCNQQKVTSHDKDEIPLLMMASEATGGETGDRENALLGCWDVKKGKITWGQEPIFT